jgi:hypothetical protein
MAVTLAAGQLERHAPEPRFLAAVAVDQIDPADLTVAVEDVVVFVLPRAREAGAVGAAEDELH